MEVSCFGFGNDGHRIIGAIAQTNLTAEAAREVKDLLGTESLADVSTWADEIRSNPKYFFAEPLHFINVPREATKVDETRDCKNGSCVTAAIRKYTNILRDHSRSPAERVEALKFVVHFVGDVHQPLHVSYRDDLGGNRVNVTWLGTANWSLHSVWDAGFVNKRRGTSSWKQVANDIGKAISPTDRAALGQILDPLSWANESLQLTRKIYGELPADGNLTQEYYKQNVKLFERQLAAGGIRLANLLNEVFASNVAPLASATETSSAPLLVCTFNVQFLGQSSERDNAALADVVKNNDIVVIEELIAPPFEGRFPNGTPFKPDPEAAAFFKAMAAQGFGYVLSEEDTGKGSVNHLNSTATEWWVVFFKSNRVDYAVDLPHGFLDTRHTAHPEFDRVPYAFGFRSKNHNTDFVLISVHLRPGAGPANSARRAQELNGIAKWIGRQSSSEKDFIILGDMNIEDQRDLAGAMPQGLRTLNAKLEATNTNVNGPKPYDHVMYNPESTREIDLGYGFKVIHLVERMKDYWGKTEPYPGDEPYQHNKFRKYYTDHNPVVFRITTDRPDDD
jgi:hypothetical protein